MERPAYAPPRKRSILIAGHQTSISLEPVFWALLEREARRSEVSLNALVAQIDADRLEAARPPNLTSALRQFLLANALADRIGE
ncbi:MAG: ribbon-helix-helix domain-containing protein [Sphingomicrobium sp.]